MRKVNTKDVVEEPGLRRRESFAEREGKSLLRWDAIPRLRTQKTGIRLMWR